MQATAASANAKVTAALKCAPLMWPTAEIPNMITSSNVTATPTWPAGSEPVVLSAQAHVDGRRKQMTAQSRETPQLPTAADVAAEVGMSVAAVSLVINGKASGRVSEGKQALVWAAVERLGYAVDPVARSLATGLRSQVALVVPDFLNPAYSGIAMGVAEALGPSYQLSLVVTELGVAPGQPSLSQAMALRPGGLVVAAPSERLLRSVDVTCPLVLADAAGYRSSVPTVNMDVAGGARRLADHLVDLGHRRVAYLDGTTATATFSARRSALTRRLSSRGAAVVARARSHVGPDSASAAFRTVWPEWQGERVTAVVCATDLQAYGVLREAGELGLAIPGTFALAGFDNLPFSSIIDPGLTTVELPYFLLGKAAGSLLLQVIGGETEEALPLIGGELVIRPSTVGRD